jgi:hypothetical protein
LFTAWRIAETSICPSLLASPSEQTETAVLPKAMFLETVIVDGREIPRFRLVGSENTPSG